MTYPSLEGKRILIVGMARSGFAAARLLLSLGARPVLSDIRTEIEGVQDLVNLGCVSRLGDTVETLVPGCDAVLVSPAVPPDAPVLRAAERLGVPVWAELEVAARYTRGLQIAITGTNGKTTTCALVGDIFKNAGKTAYVAGNIGLPLSAVAPMTGEGDFTVIEVSSFQLEHMETFHPQVAAILNLSPDHLNRHGTMEAYGALKTAMLRHQTKDDFFIYNADNPFCASVAKEAAVAAIPFSRLGAVREGAWVQDGQIMLSGRALCGVEELSLPGPHNVENALAAAAIAGVLDIPPPVIRHTLRSFAGMAHRMELVCTRGGVRWINDSKGTNPESSTRGVQGMKVPTILIAGGDDKESDFTGFAQAIAESGYIRRVILIGRTAGRIEEALRASGYADITTVGADFAAAVALADRLSEEGGAVLLSPACASFDMFKDYEARGDSFKALVRALARDKGDASSL